MNINMRMRTVYDSYDIDNDRFAFAVFKMAAVQKNNVNGENVERNLPLFNILVSYSIAYVVRS